MRARIEVDITHFIARVNIASIMKHCLDHGNNAVIMTTIMKHCLDHGNNAVIMT